MSYFCAYSRIYFCFSFNITYKNGVLFYMHTHKHIHTHTHMVFWRSVRVSNKYTICLNKWWHSLYNSQKHSDSVTRTNPQDLMESMLYLQLFFFPKCATLTTKISHDHQPMRVWVNAGLIFIIWTIVRVQHCLRTSSWQYRGSCLNDVALNQLLTK